jgi:hypothetical protein
MMKRALVLVLLIATVQLAKSQSVFPDVIGSNGNYFANANYSVAWTLGEVMNETYSSPANFLTQGFHQPAYVSPTVVKPISPGAAISIYPNPVVNDLTISFGDSQGTFEIKIYDAIGQIVSRESIVLSGSPGTKHIVAFDGFASALYFLQIVNADASIQASFSIIKSN